MSLGETIYRLRTEKQMSQGDLAEKLDVSRQSISKWENNSAVPDLEKIIKLSEIFEVSLDELIKGEKSKKETTQEVKTQIIYEKQAGFAPRKIAGTILLCMAFLVAILIAVAGGGVAGVIFATPFLVCGIICFAFQKNIGLWCVWAVYVLLDIFMLNATGINRSYIRQTLIWTHHMNYMRLAFAWVLVISLWAMITVTVVRLSKQSGAKKITKKAVIISWIITVGLQLAAMVWGHSSTYKYIMENIRTMGKWYMVITVTLSWSRIIAATTALVYTVRLLLNKKVRRKGSES